MPRTVEPGWCCVIVSNGLDGKSVVVTRSASQNASLRMLLEARGAEVIEVPLLSIEEPEDNGYLRDELLQKFDQFDWLVITSPNGADRVAPFLAASAAAGDAQRMPRIAAVGEATAQSLGLTTDAVDLVASPARASVLVEQFPEGSGTVLLVQGDLADNEVADGLATKGWIVARVTAYRTVQLRPSPEMMVPALAADVLLLASGSAASAWFDAFGSSTPAIVVSIGPSTTKVAQRLGIDITATAPEQTLASLVATAEELLSQ